MKKPNITFKSLLQPIKNIEERNAYFDYLSNEGKRLEIAWDMLQLLVQEKLTAIGVNVTFWGNTLINLTYEVNAKEVQRILCTTKLSRCTVCARGGLMVSQLRLGNSFTYHEINHGAGTSSTIKGFTYDDYLRIEKEYEHSIYNHPYTAGTTEKLMNICCNILVNGNFNTNDRTDYLID